MMKNSVVKTTGQTWKLAGAVLAMLIGSILPAFPEAGVSWTVGTILAIAGYALGVYLIRCPACKVRWFWDALTRPEFYGEVLKQPSCPECKRVFTAAGPG